MKVLAAVIVTLAVPVILGIVFMYSGIYNVAASEPHTRLVFWVLSTTMENSVEARAGQVQVPQGFEARATDDAARHYSQMCETCHGAPGVEPSEIGKGLNPKPPDLKKKARELSPAELFWIAKHGIKMSGMPAFGKTYADEDLWRTVAFIKKLPRIGPAEYRKLVQRRGASDVGSRRESSWVPADISLRTDRQSIEEGKRIYQENCTPCHAPHSHKTIVGPGHKDILHRDKLPVSGRPATVENVARQLKAPFRAMPSFAKFSKGQVEDIVAYLNTL